MQDEARQKIEALVSKYESAKKNNKLGSYTEEDTKKDFILPLFEALGWNTSERNEVSSEEHIKSAGRVDYGFYLNNRAVFYLEAKPLRADLNRQDYANQSIRYSWNKGVTWAILTDFESIKVFNAEAVSKYLGDKLVFSIPYNEFISRFDQLWQLSKKSFEENSLDKYAEEIGKKLQHVPVSELLYKDLNECRKILLNVFKKWNNDKGISNALFEEGVQKLIDRLILIRVLEDRGIEENTLRPLVRSWENSGKAGQITLFASMIPKFRELDEIYNSNVFSPHPFEEWDEFSNTTKDVIELFYGKKGYYEYDFKVMPADILGNVYENYLGYILSQSQKGVAVTENSTKRKEQGIYYTPSFVVDYIVKNSLTPVLNRCKTIADLKKISVLDPACGSGSFLIKALEVINEKYIEMGAPGNEFTKLQIITENLYGVDLDEQAIEIARLNLLISALDRKMKLPSLSHNIKNGNSLISGSDQELEKYFGKNFKEKKPFDWQEEFPEVFKQGGFDVVIGNPPYGAVLDNNDKKYFNENCGTSEYQLDTYILFLDKAYLLLKEKGNLGFITPNTWLTNINMRTFREKIVNFQTIEKIVNYSSKVFPAATVDTITIIISKLLPSENHSVDIMLVHPNSSATFRISQSSWKNGPIINLFTDNPQKKIIEKIEQDSLPLSEICYVAAGVKPYEIGKGNPTQTKEMLEKRIYDSEYKQDDTFLPLLRGKDINRYLIKWDGKRWIKYGNNLAAPRKKGNFLVDEKLVIRQTGDSLVATMDYSQFICMNNLHTINTKNTEYKLKIILGLLNSKTINFYYQYLNPEKGEALAEVKVANVNRLPIKRISIKNNSIYGRIAIDVEKILNLNNSLKSLIENSNDWEKNKSEVDNLDRNIDALVYKLYGLEGDEIKIVEESSKSSR